MTYTIPPNIQEQIDESDFICGSDEVGYGCWAGPLVVCAAVVPRGWSWVGVTDSKKLTEKKIRGLGPVLQANVIHSIKEVSPQEIDEKGMTWAWEHAHKTAIQGAWNALHEKHPQADPLVIIDGSKGVLGAVALPKADLLVPAVSAASIIAKNYRDTLMRKLAPEHPGFGFDRHVGYGTPDHKASLAKFGVTKIHRMSYEPMASMNKES